MVASVRISGVNLPVEKKVYVSLSYLFGVGMVTAKQICKACKVNCEKRMKELSDEDIEKIRNYIDKHFVVEGDLRGQRTKTNAKTRKGRSAPIANKKVVAK